MAEPFDARFSHRFHFHRIHRGGLPRCQRFTPSSDPFRATADHEPSAAAANRGSSIRKRSARRRGGDVEPIPRQAAGTGPDGVADRDFELQRLVTRDDQFGP